VSFGLGVRTHRPGDNSYMIILCISFDTDT